MEINLCLLSYTVSVVNFMAIYLMTMACLVCKLYLGIEELKADLEMILAHSSSALLLCGPIS